MKIRFKYIYIVCFSSKGFFIYIYIFKANFRFMYIGTNLLLRMCTCRPTNALNSIIHSIYIYIFVCHVAVFVVFTVSTAHNFSEDIRTDERLNSNAKSCPICCFSPATPKANACLPGSIFTNMEAILQESESPLTITSSCGLG